jgi:hypothetical protein
MNIFFFCHPSIFFPQISNHFIASETAHWYDGHLFYENNNFNRLNQIINMTKIWLLLLLVLFLIQSLITTTNKQYILLYLIVIGIVSYHLYKLSADKLVNNPRSRELFVSDVLLPLYANSLPKSVIKIVESDTKLLNSLKIIYKKTDSIFMTELTEHFFNFLVTYVKNFNSLNPNLLLNLDSSRSKLQFFTEIESPMHQVVRSELQTVYKQMESYIYALENKLTKKDKLFDRIEEDWNDNYSITL